LNRVSLVQYSPRRQSRWVLADYGGKDLWKRRVLSLEWNSECVMEGVVGAELWRESVINTAEGHSIPLHYTICARWIW